MVAEWSKTLCRSSQMLWRVLGPRFGTTLGITIKPKLLPCHDPQRVPTWKEEPNRQSPLLIWIQAPNQSLPLSYIAGLRQLWRHITLSMLLTQKEIPWGRWIINFFCYFLLSRTSFWYTFYVLYFSQLYTLQFYALVWIL